MAASTPAWPGCSDQGPRGLGSCSRLGWSKGTASDTSKPSPLQPADSLGISPAALGRTRALEVSPRLTHSAFGVMELRGWLKTCSELSLSCPDPDPGKSQQSRNLHQGPLCQVPKLLSSAACPLLVLLSAPTAPTSTSSSS